MPDLRELRNFVAVAESRGFTRAAERLGSSRQKVSRAIRELEAGLGVELLDRTPRGIELTAAGAALLDPAKATLAQAEVAFDAAREVGGDGATRAPREDGAVTVGFSAVVGPVGRAAVVEALRADGDRLLAAHDLAGEEIAASLRDRSVDICVVSVSDANGDIDRAELRPERMQIHVPSRHPLAAAGTAELGDFDGERLLTAALGSAYTELLVARFAAAGATVDPVEPRGEHGSLLGELVARDAIAAMPEGTPSPPGVTSVETPGFTMPMVVLWPSDRAVEAVDHLRERLGLDRAPTF